MIEVGEYVRTKDKILKIDSFDKDIRNIDCVCFTTGEIYTQELLNKIMVKHSKNIIDLIEEGDYINGMEVLDIYKSRDLWEPIEIRVNSRYTNYLIADEIKTVLTKEQYEANCYKVEE